MGGERQRDRRERQAERRFTDLSALKRELDASGGGLEIALPAMAFGDVWWITDEFTGVGNRQEHPWVVIVPYEPGRAAVVACLRTTTNVHSYGKEGLVTPIDTSIGLTAEGCVVFIRQQKFSTQELASFRYAGRLPEPVRERLRQALDEWGKMNAEQSEA